MYLKRGICLILILFSLQSLSVAETVVLDGSACQETVNGLSDLLEPFQSTQGYDSASVMDVMTFFSALDRLRMEEGYLLDFLYESYSGGGHPILIARPADITIDEAAEMFEETYSVQERESGLFKIEYLEHIETDGSPEAFFQLSLLEIMGFHFNLTWHSLEFDDTVICDISGLEGIQSNLAEEGKSLPENDLGEMADVDLRPSIVSGAETVEVSVITFTKWGGFERHRMTFEKEFPHSLVSDSTETVLYCSIGGRF